MTEIAASQWEYDTLVPSPAKRVTEKLRPEELRYLTIDDPITKKAINNFQVKKRILIPESQRRLLGQFNFPN
ncbi:MAG: hypothetical protein OSA89_14320 [Mariniblastus sp.]|nr:hypothetical protein [Mariniblastus sp.]